MNQSWCKLSCFATALLASALLTLTLMLRLTDVSVQVRLPLTDINDPGEVIRVIVDPQSGEKGADFGSPDPTQEMSSGPSLVQSSTIKLSDVFSFDGIESMVD